MNPETNAGTPRAPSRAYSLVVILGGSALIGAMAIDTVAVIGRHTGMPLLGSIELVQLLVGVSGAMALLVATLRDSHAVVRLLLANIPAQHAALLQRVNAVAATLFFAALTAGSAWIMREMWGSHEETELLRLPLAPLRLLIVAALGVTTLLFLRKALHRSSHDRNA
ncbi:MAG TPA: TRAP transporter small permease subunit [Pseudomonadales bacterium]